MACSVVASAKRILLSRTGSEVARHDSTERVALRGKGGQSVARGRPDAGQPPAAPGRPITESAAPSFNARACTGYGAPRADDASWRVVSARWSGSLSYKDATSATGRSNPHLRVREPARGGASPNACPGDAAPSAERPATAPCRAEGLQSRRARARPLGRAHLPHRRPRCCFVFFAKNRPIAGAPECDSPASA